MPDDPIDLWFRHYCLSRRRMGIVSPPLPWWIPKWAPWWVKRLYWRRHP